MLPINQSNVIVSQGNLQANPPNQGNVIVSSLKMTMELRSFDLTLSFGESDSYRTGRGQYRYRQIEFQLFIKPAINIPYNAIPV
jgi:hypothetical protein